MATAPSIDFVAAAVDQLGSVKARIAELKAEEARLAALIINSGDDAVDGGLFRATIVTTAERKSPDPKAMEQKLLDLGVDGRWFSKHQKTTKGSTIVRVVARKS